MNNARDYIDINFDLNEEYLYVNQETNLQITIRNKSDVLIENGLFKLILNNSIFKIKDSKLTTCINDFINIGKLEPGFKLVLNVPLEVMRIPDDLYESIFSYLNFHIVKDEQILDFAYKSNNLNINFISKMQDKDFIVRFSKAKYFIDEEIHLFLRLDNSAKYILENLKIENFVPENTIILKDKATASIPDRLLIYDDLISLRNINPGETIDLDICLKILDNVDVDKLQISPTVQYTDQSSLQIEIIKPTLEVDIDYSNLFSSKNFIYELDKEEGFIDDIVTHKLTIRNESELELLDLYLENNFSDRINFVENSLISGDIYRIGEDLNNPLKIGDLEQGEEIIVTFKTKIDSIENIEDIKFMLNYKTNRKAMYQESNSVEIKTLYPEFNELSFRKYQDKNILKLYEIVNITIEASNVGTSPAKNVLIKDILPSGLEFMDSTLYINDKPMELNILNEGIKINNVDINETIKIKYKAKALDICTNEGSKAYISYTSKNQSKVYKEYSNETLTTVIGARIGNNSIGMTLSDYSAQIGDIITYTVMIKNTGNLVCESLKLQVPLNDALEFVSQSLRIDDKDYVDLNVFDGISLSRIEPNKDIKISYEVKILDFPRPNPIIDRAKLTYSYMFENNVENNSVYSVKNKLYINNPILDVIDRNAMFNRFEADLFEKTCFNGDNIYFNLELKNRGNVGIKDIHLKLSSLKNIMIDEESIRVNNREYSKIENDILKLPNLNVSQKTFLEFYAKCIPTKECSMVDPFVFEYEFKDLKTQESKKKIKRIKENIIVVNPDLEVTKFISDKDLEVDREFTKNINITNTGNIPLENVVLDLNESDFLRQCNKVVFIDGNYAEYGDKICIEELDINETSNIAIRYNVHTLEGYINTVPESVVSAEYKIANHNESSKIQKKSNKLNINIKKYILDIAGQSTSKTIMMGAINKYIIKVINDGNIDCQNVNFKIEVPKEITYLEDSLCINGKNLGIQDLSSSIELGSLEYNQVKNISFDFEVNSLPYKNKFKILSQAECEYKNDYDDIITKSFKSDDQVLNVENIALDIVKIPSSETLQRGDVLQIQTIINNVGSINIKDLHLCDNHNKNLIFIKDSVYIDGEQAKNLDPLKGIQLPEIESEKNILLTYEYKYMPTISSNKIIHFSNTNYCYELNGKEERVSTKSNTLYLEGALSTFKEFSMETEYELKEYEPNIKDIVSVSTNASIDQYYEISTMKNVSVENEESTGKKVIIKGVVTDRVEYLTDNENSSLYMLERSQPFSLFINLPNDYDGEEIYFNPKCDNVFYKSLGSKSLFISSLISIEGSF
ncbi:MAG: SPOCS domain-containing protein [Romboutsia sp.]|uniref:SPOCS domain-containing protein n=1 Tax=Romboutsia sp. TaxID=1965302 RepID=UPI003F3B68ED